MQLNSLSLKDGSKLRLRRFGARSRPVDKFFWPKREASEPIFRSLFRAVDSREIRRLGRSDWFASEDPGRRRAVNMNFSLRDALRRPGPMLRSWCGWDARDEELKARCRRNFRFF